MHLFIENLLDGLYLGLIYALIASGYSIIYSVLNMINFTHGEVFMVGSFASLTVLNILHINSLNNIFNLLLAMLVSGLCSAVLSVFLYRFIYSSVMNISKFVPLVSAIAMSTLLQMLVQNFYPNGRSRVSYPTITGSIEIGGYTISLAFIVVLSVFLFISAFLIYIFKFTSIGIKLRAVSNSKFGAEVSGINIDTIILFGFFISGFIAGISSVCQGIKFHSIQYDMGFIAGLKGFTSAVMGGIGGLLGPIVTGIFLGIMEIMISFYIYKLPYLQKFGGSEWKDLWIYLILLFVLLCKPNGIFSKGSVDRF